eukprot:617892-Amphidinium_carterae.2
MLRLSRYRLTAKVNEVCKLVLPTCVELQSGSRVRIVLSAVMGDPVSCFIRCGWRWDWGVARPATEDRPIAVVLCAKCRPFFSRVAPWWVCVMVSPVGSSVVTRAQRAWRAM